MTTTKVVFFLAVVIPFGFVLLGAALVLRKLYVLHREDVRRRNLQPAG
jgi:hypothetical protein